MSRTCPETDPCVTCCPGGQTWDNMGMEEMMNTLRRIGLPGEEIERIKAYYRNDPDGLKNYVLYMKALFDDCHEYI